MNAGGLGVAHSEHRREKMLAAYEALKSVADEDRKIVDKWVVEGRVNYKELGRLIADYRELLGRMIAKPKMKQILKDLMPSHRTMRANVCKEKL